MRSNLLLCELHAHTTWSNGFLTMTELVDLYGRHGFDVLCVTDHLLRSDSRRFRLGHQTHAHYVATIRRESRRTREQYDLLLIPGLELTQLADDPDEAGHALALGLHTLCSVDDGLEPAMHAARDAGAAIVAVTHTAPGTIRAAGAPPAGSPGIGSGWTASSTATSSSSAGRRSAGSPRQGCRESPPATSTGSSTCGSGRRCCPAPKTSTP